MKNKYAKVLKDRQKSREKIVSELTIRLCLDAADVALNEEFGFGADRLCKFEKRFSEIFPTYSKGLGASSDADYYRMKIDQRLKQIFKDRFIPWKKRYYRWPQDMD